MKWFLYNCMIQLFSLGVAIHSLFNAKSKLAAKGRKDKVKLKPKVKKRLWVHCASLGEFEQAKPVIEKVKLKRDCELIVTFFSPSGYEVKKDYHLADYVLYLPLDTKRNASDFVTIVKPDFVIFVKYEFWWNFIRVINAKQIPFIFISASFRPGQYFFRPFAKTFSEELKKIKKLFVIKKDTQDLLLEEGFTNVLVGGDNRIESILTRKQKSKPISTIEEFKEDSPLLIFGSTYSTEHEEIIKIAENLIKEFKVLIFPHELHAKEINRLHIALGEECQIYSKIEEEAFCLNTYKILIVDKIGFLAEAYQYADIAYIGGGFNSGIHNILEAFVYKIPFVFGPDHEKFEEAIILKKYNFATAIEATSELMGAIKTTYSQKDRTEIENAFEDFFDESQFGSDQIVKLICETI